MTNQCPTNCTVAWKLTNYERTLEGSAFDDSNGSVATSHRQQIENRLVRIDHDLTDASATLEAANIAIRTLRAKYEQVQAEEAKNQTMAIQERAQEEQLRATEQAHAEMRTQDMLAMLALIIAVSQTIASDLELMAWRFFVFIILLMGASLFVRWREIKRYEQLHRSSTASQITTTTPDQIADST